MTTAGVRLSRMRVKAWRGISDATEFDFSAPLTLVYAPNGTGKTTMCEAAEWLLTGQVLRLREGKDFNPALLRSRFVEDTQPCAEAQLYVDGAHRYLRRVATGSMQEAYFGSDPASLGAIGPNDLLGALAATAAAQETHPLRAINLRQQWLRGTRFLSADALAALIDSDDATIVRRTQVFADLLGIRHLLDAERACDKFVQDHAGRERTLDALIAQRTEVIDRLAATLDARQAMPGPTEGRNELRSMLDALDAAPDPALSGSDAMESDIDRVTARLAQRRQALNQRRDSLHRIESEWDQWTDNVTSVQFLEQALQSQTQLLEHLQGEAHAIAVTVEKLERHRDALRTDISLLAAARDRLSTIAATLTAHLLVSNELTLQNATLDDLERLLPEARWTEAAREARRAALLDLANQREQVPLWHARQGSLAADLALIEPDLENAEALEMLRGEAASLDRAAMLARERLAATASPIEQLQAAARALLDHDHGLASDACPLCMHSWRSAQQLREAIENGLAAAPALVRQAQEQAARASEDAARARARFEHAQAQAARVHDIHEEARVIDQILGAFSRDCAELGIDPQAAAAIVFAEQRLVAADQLARLVSECVRVNETLAESELLALPRDTVVTVLATAIEEMMWQRGETIRAAMEALAPQLAQAISDHQAARSRLAEAELRAKDNREHLGKTQAALSALRELWLETIGEPSRTLGALRQALQAASGEQQRLNGIEQRLAGVRATWLTQKDRAQLSALREGLRPLDAERSLLRHRLAAARRVAVAFRTTYSRVSAQQFRDLERVVNPLFARMHANHVFDRIKLGNPDRPVQWAADADELEFDPGSDFSQGQRQDLALALFLARARGLGGTFFLDEPMTHLDDLNRVGLLDIFRATVMESSSRLNLVITTASLGLARHLVEKFSALPSVPTPEGKSPPLRVLELAGNGRAGVNIRQSYPAVSQ